MHSLTGASAATRSDECQALEDRVIELVETMPKRTRRLAAYG